jgi:hypothetical protein
MLPWYVSCGVLAKTSLLGLGLVTLGLAVVALIALRLFGRQLPAATQGGLKRIFKCALYLHIGTYLLLLIKLGFAIAMDSGWQDVPTFIISHLVTHHVMSALIATVLIVLSIRLYNQRHAEHLQISSQP